eukprot:6331658-Pyramimonas_sp.AAC.1
MPYLSLPWATLKGVSALIPPPLWERVLDVDSVAFVRLVDPLFERGLAGDGALEVLHVVYVKT